MPRNSAVALSIALLSWTLIFPAASRADNGDPAAMLATKTPIKHVVVIFDENISSLFTGSTVRTCRGKPARLQAG